MAYEGWLTYSGNELVNLSRTAQLSVALGIDTVRTKPSSVQWIQDALGGVDYGDVTTAPWYDADYPASGEFAGLLPLSIAGLDDSTMESTPIEYITDGGHSGLPRSSTLPIVANMVAVASTARGAEFGKRWMDRTLRNNGLRVFCAGSDLEYFLFKQQGAAVPGKAHRRNVRLTRGSSVTRKRVSECSTGWWITFTLTAADPFEYGEAVVRAEELGSGVAEPGWIGSGSTALVELSCPAYDYSPVYDPLYPALVPPPPPPSLFPDGWNIAPGDTFQRWWAQVDSIPPQVLNVIPIITLRATAETRMVRVSVWAEVDGEDAQCGALFSAVVTYIPPDVDFVIDGEQKASYTWDGASPAVRRADSLVFSPDANPVEWTTFNDGDSFFITLDVFNVDSDVPGAGEVLAKFEFLPKSD